MYVTHALYLCSFFTHQKSVAEIASGGATPEPDFFVWRGGGGLSTSPNPLAGRKGASLPHISFSTALQEIFY